MPYIAKIDIGDYKKGDVVPEDKAKVWSTMYVESPVDFIEDEPKSELKVEPKEEIIKQSLKIKKGKKKKFYGE